MARISLLISLALVLAIGTVLAHPPNPKKTQNTLCPPTLAGLQNFPFIEISKLIEKKTQSAPNTIQFKALLAICKSYNDYLGAFKFSGVKKVFGSIHTKYTLMTKAMLAAQASLGVEGELAVKLRKSYSTMAEGFVEVVEMINEFSKKYKFEADAKISKSDKAKIEKCLIKLKGSVTVFLKLISQCSKNFSGEKKIVFPITPGGGFIGASFKAGAKVGGQGEAKVGAQAGGNVGGGFLRFGGKVQYDAADKAKFGGGNGFRSLSHPHEKHLN